MGSTRAGRAGPARPNCFQFVCYLLSSIKKLLLMQDDPPSIFKASARISPTAPRVVAWSTIGHSVEDLKALGKKLGGASINDVLLVALAGALKRHGQQSRQAVADNIQSVMWVSLAPLKHLYADFNEVPFKWGNSTLGACYLPLQVGGPDASASDMLADVRSNTNDPKLMVEAVVAAKIQTLIGWFPRVAFAPIFPLVANKVSVSMSNMPGPQWDLEFCGGPARHMLFFVPPTGTISMFCTIATFNGHVTIRMGSDATLLRQDQLSKISGELFEAEIKRLMEVAGSSSV